MENCVYTTAAMALILGHCGSGVLGWPCGTTSSGEEQASLAGFEAEVIKMPHDKPTGGYKVYVQVGIVVSKNSLVLGRKKAYQLGVKLG